MALTRTSKDEYTAKAMTIEFKLNDIRAALHAHKKDSGDPHWGHVGDLGRCLDDLQAALEALGGA